MTFCTRSAIILLLFLAFVNIGICSGNFISGLPVFQRPVPSKAYNTPIDSNNRSNGLLQVSNAQNSGIASTDTTKKVVIKSFAVSGRVTGLVQGNNLNVVIGTLNGNLFNKLDLAEVSVDSPTFNFSVRKGKYYLKVEGSGYFLSGTQLVSTFCVTNCKFLNNTESDEFVVKFAKDKPNNYTFLWKISYSAQFGEEMLNALPTQDIQLQENDNVDDEIETMDTTSSGAKLLRYYGIKLQGKWGSSYSDRLLAVFERFSMFKQYADKNNKVFQKWSLTDVETLQHDVRITLDETKGEGYNIVQIYKGAFRFAKKKVHPTKKNAAYFSRRLYKAVLRAQCLHNPEKMKQLFEERHEVKLLEPKREGSIIEKLSGYSRKEYQSWFLHPEELVEIATSWEEYPAGFHKVSGLNYILRRKDGVPHPLYPTAPAVAWPTAQGESFIEFMESGFNKYPEVSKLVLHEIAHFIYYRSINRQLHQSWIETGKWTPNPNDPDGWSTSLQTEFVSAYAHKISPSEDFAESVAYYMLNPRKLKSRSPNKFTWVKENVMGGSEYMIAASKTFEVLNYNDPDLNYPGKIRKIIIKVDGMQHEDKQVSLVFKIYGKTTNRNCAVNITFRMYSDIGTISDRNIRADKGECLFTLKSSFVMGKNLRRGVWTTDQLVVTDQTGLKRFMGMSDFGFRLWLNNHLEDITSPNLMYTSISLKLVPVPTGERSIRTAFLVKENTSLGTDQVALTAIARVAGEMYSLEHYSGKELEPADDEEAAKFYDQEWSGHRLVPTSNCFELPMTAEDIAANWKCYQVATLTYMSQYILPGEYRLRHITITDVAKNMDTADFVNGRHRLQMASSDPDREPPFIENVVIRSVPMNPSNPDGETKVTLSFVAYDDKSGIGQITYIIRDPQGTEHHNYGLHPNYFTQKYKGDPVARTPYSFEKILPKGSIPGAWYLAKISLYDKVGNRKDAKFYESILVENAS